MKVQNKVEVYEVDDMELPAGREAKTITIESHWRWTDKVVINTHGMGIVTMSVDDLEKAIRNACNH